MAIHLHLFCSASLYLSVGVRVSEQIGVDLTVYDLPISSLPLMRWHTIGVPEGENKQVTHCVATKIQNLTKN